MTYRPGGVIALAIFFIIFAALGIVSVVILEAAVIATTVSQASFGALLEIIIGLYWGFPLGNTLLLATITYVILTSSVGYFHIASGIAIIVVAIYIFTAVGLLQMKSWGYYLALIIGILMIIGGIIGLFIVIGILPLIFGIVVVVYLLGDVKYEFE